MSSYDDFGSDFSTITCDELSDEISNASTIVVPNGSTNRGKSRKGCVWRSEKEIRAIISHLMRYLVHERKCVELTKGALAATSRHFSIPPTTVARIWKKAKANYEDPKIKSFWAPQDRSLMGGKQFWNRSDLKEAISVMPYSDRTTIRQMSAKLSVPKSTLHNILKEQEVMVPHTSSLKPYLREDNKLLRIAYSADSVTTNSEGSLVYDPSFDVVHVDEKWFYLTQECKRVYLTVDEKTPERETQNKGHITKVSLWFFDWIQKISLVSQ